MISCMTRSSRLVQSDKKEKGYTKSELMRCSLSIPSRTISRSEACHQNNHEGVPDLSVFAVALVSCVVALEEQQERERDLR
jgi:hypothetical protein